MDLSELGAGTTHTDILNAAIALKGHRPKITKLDGETRRQYETRWQANYRSWLGDLYNLYVEARRKKNPQKVLDIAKKSYHKNKEKNKEKFAEKRKNRRHKDAPKQKAWREANPDRVKENMDRWLSENKDHYRAQQQAYQNNRLETDLEYKLLHYMRSRMRGALKLKSAKKCSTTMGLLGCTPDEFKAHLESLFDANMSWENYGSYWEIDHIKPCVSFDLTDPAQQKACFHYTNCRPLEKEENRKKGAKLIFHAPGPSSKTDNSPLDL